MSPYFNFNIIWIFGLPCAGKSTLARALQKRFEEKGHPCLKLDGDELRVGLCHGLGFSSDGRQENVRRAAEVALLSANSGICAVTALITPSELHRDVARSVLKNVSVLWVWAKCSSDVCQQRDVKGLYREQREGRLMNLTGADGEFEIPRSDVLQIDTEHNDIENAIALIWHALTESCVE